MIKVLQFNARCFDPQMRVTGLTVNSLSLHEVIYTQLLGLNPFYSQWHTLCFWDYKFSVEDRQPSKEHGHNVASRDVDPLETRQLRGAHEDLHPLHLGGAQFSSAVEGLMPIRLLGPVQSGFSRLYGRNDENSLYMFLLHKTEKCDHMHCIPTSHPGSRFIPPRTRGLGQPEDRLFTVYEHYNLFI